MLLRRLTEHVRNQNWFAVGLDFVIVVVGVFVGLQVSNWNDSVRVQALEQSYLARLADELTDNIAMFATEEQFSAKSKAVLGQFLRSVNDPTVSDADLIKHTADYFSIGTFLADYRPSQATFDDLKSTGNLEILRNRELREALVKLHSTYDADAQTFGVNLDWVLPTDGQVYMSFDALRFDARTAQYFAPQATDDTAQYIRENKDLLARHAALHLWLKDRAIEVLSDAAEQTRSVLGKIEELQ
jgi:hypothetical protein